MNDNIELELLDCNCNNCIFMIRDLEKYKKSKEWHYKLQLDYFNLIKKKTKDINMRFEFDSSAICIHYGKCNKFNKDITFIPNILQLDTQNCFKHRKLNKL